MAHRMRATAVLFVALSAAISFDLSAQSEQAQRISPELRDRLAKGESVRVIVELRRPAGAPAGRQGDAARAAHAQAQDRLLERVPHIGSAKRLVNLPIVALEVDSRALSELETSPDVVSVRVDELRRPTLSQSVPLIGAPTAWSLGATGDNWTVAVLDTGVDKSHPFLAGKVVSEACYSTVGGTASSVCPGGIDTTAVGSGVPCSAGIHGCDHGTHMAGIAAGTGVSFSGVAKDASIIAIQVYSRIDDVAFCTPNPSPCVGAFDSDVLAGLDRVFTLRSQHSIAAATVALGGGSFPGTCDAVHTAYKTAIDLLRGAGIATVISSGNSGFANGMTAPACVSSAISVGASNKSDQLWPNTNRSPVLKLLAPGVSINSPAPGGSFSIFTGTSMAAAHVAGAWAVVKQRNPTAGVTSVLNSFVATAVGIADVANGVTRPRINVGAAVSSARLLGALPDFDGQHTGDILWSHATPGTFAMWLMNGGVLVDSSVITVGAEWRVVGFGDANGDGRSDIVWRQPATGLLAIWFMNGTVLQSTAVFSVGTEWDLVGTGDVNGDAKDDLVWRQPATGLLAVWFMNGSSLLSSALFGVGTEWALLGVGDVNGDGKADFVWRQPATGLLAVWFMNGSSLLSSVLLGNVGTEWTPLG
jgi:subtilisin